MLFFIDAALAQIISSGSTDRLDIVNAVEHIAHARREGKHLVFGERNTIRLLKESNLISITARNVYAKLYDRLPQDKAYFDKMLWFVHVVDDLNVLKLFHLNGKNIIKISAQYLENFSLLNETVILSENQDDVELYEFIAKSYLAWSQLGQVIIRFDPRGGGGNTTAREYLSIQQRGERLCLCILDSDYKYQGAGFGDTVRAVQRIDEINQPLCMLIPLSVREIENLIPTSIYREVSHGDPNRMRAVLTLEMIEASTSSEARKFLDLKKGFRLFEFLQLNVDSPHYVYWHKVINEVGALSVCAAASCCNRREDCTCFVFHGFGTSILAATIEHISQKSISDVVSMIDRATMVEWALLGEVILAWCCGSSRLSTT